MTTAKAVWRWFKRLSTKDKAAVAVWPALPIIVVLAIWIAPTLPDLPEPSVVSKQSEVAQRSPLARTVPKFSEEEMLVAAGCWPAMADIPGSRPRCPSARETLDNLTSSDLMEDVCEGPTRLRV